MVQFSKLKTDQIIYYLKNNKIEPVKVVEAIIVPKIDDMGFIYRHFYHRKKIKIKSAYTSKLKNYYYIESEAYMNLLNKINYKIKSFLEIKMETELRLKQLKEEKT